MASFVHSSRSDSPFTVNSDDDDDDVADDDDDDVL